MSTSRINPEQDTAIAYYNEGCMLILQNKFDKALKKFNLSIQYNSQLANVWHNKGITEHKLGMIKEAIISFKEVIKLENDNLEAWNRLGVLNSYIKNYDVALEAFDKILWHTPHSYKILSNKGVILNQLNRHGEAIEVINLAISLNKNYSLGYYNLASVYASLTDAKNAIKYLKKADLNDKSVNFSEKSLEDNDFKLIRKKQVYQNHIKETLSPKTGNHDFANNTIQ